eukprot:scaffold247874_cov35-Tisochrysis_lutea.AAC.1
MGTNPPSTSKRTMTLTHQHYNTRPHRRETAWRRLGAHFTLLLYQLLARTRPRPHHSRPPLPRGSHPQMRST